MTMSAIEFRNVDIVFGNRPKDALALIDEGATRDEILAKTGSVLGAAGIDLNVAPISALPFKAIMSLKLAHGGMLTGGAKSSELPYLSEMYLMNSMNRT